MIYHADIPNGDYIESLTIEASSSEDAYATASAYILKAFGKEEGPPLVKAWSSLSVPVPTGIVHFAHRKDDDSDYSVKGANTAMKFDTLQDHEFRADEWAALERESGQSTIDFSCRDCGVICDSAPDPPARAVCPNCCEDHDYRYERELRGHYCIHCGQEAPDDWFLDD